LKGRTGISRYPVVEISLKSWMAGYYASLRGPAFAGMTANRFRIFRQTLCNSNHIFTHSHSRQNMEVVYGQIN